MNEKKKSHSSVPPAITSWNVLPPFISMPSPISARLVDGRLIQTSATGQESSTLSSAGTRASEVNSLLKLNVDVDLPVEDPLSADDYHHIPRIGYTSPAVSPNAPDNIPTKPFAGITPEPSPSNTSHSTTSTALNNPPEKSIQH